MNNDFEHEERGLIVKRLEEAQQVWELSELLLYNAIPTKIGIGVTGKYIQVGEIELLLSIDGTLLDIWAGTKVFSMWKLKDGKPDIVSFKKGRWIDDLKRAALINLTLFCRLGRQLLANDSDDLNDRNGAEAV